MNKNLSIVIPSHNRPDLLARCLASVTAHAPAGTEVIVVDDASPAAIVTETAGRFRGVRTSPRAKRGGFCVAANQGIAAASAPIVELLNDDTEVEPGWAEAALGRFADPRVVAVAPLVLKATKSRRGPLIDSAGDRYHLGGFAAKRGAGQSVTAFPLDACPVFGASASSAFYRRDMLQRVGAFPEEFCSYFEDVDLSFRLRRAGGQIVFEPNSRVWHCVGASHGVANRQLLEQHSRNEERVFWRNVPMSVLPRAVLWHVAVLSGKAIRRWREGTLTPFLLGRLRTLAELPQLLQHRQRLALLGPEAAPEVWHVESFWTGK